MLLCYHLPNRYSWIEATARTLGVRRFHRYRFSRREAAALLEAAGLERVEWGRYALLPRNLWELLPGWLADSAPTVHGWNALDAMLERPGALLCQNHYAVARRPTAEAGNAPA